MQAKPMPAWVIFSSPGKKDSSIRKSKTGPPHIELTQQPNPTCNTQKSIHLNVEVQKLKMERTKSQ